MKVFEDAKVNGTSTDINFCILNSITGFEVDMFPDRENSRRTIHNLMSVDVPLTLASAVLENQYPDSRDQNCNSISYRRIVITTSGFEVAMLLHRENSCTTIQNNYTELVISKCSITLGIAENLGLAGWTSLVSQLHPPLLLFPVSLSTVDKIPIVHLKLVISKCSACFNVFDNVWK